MDQRFLGKDVNAGRGRLIPASALEAFLLDLRVQWSRFVIYSTAKALVYGSDL